MFKGKNMKKLLFSILFIFTSFLVSAQEEPKKKESFADEFNREIKSIGKLNYKDYPMTLGVSGGVYFPTSVSYGLSDGAVGGGAALKYKFNFNRFFAISTDLGYTYVKGQEQDYFKYTTISNMFDIKIMGIIQYERKKDETGFVPWIGTGAVISFASTKEKVEERYVSTGNVYRYTNDFSGAGIGYIVALGFRYNFKKVYTGLNFDYTLVYPGFYDVSGIRLNAELGYRF